MHRVSGTLSENTTWVAGDTYYIKSSLTVKNSLVIPAGIIVKFAKGTSLKTTDSGTITAGSSGVTAENYVVFTSYLDNDTGITIPEFKDSATSAAAGDWKSVWIYGAQGSSFTNCEFKYAGGGTSAGSCSALYISKSTTVKNCKFHDNKSYYSSYIGALGIADNSSAIESVVTDNFFYDNEWPFSCPANYTVDTSNEFVVTDHLNKYQAITLIGERTIAASKTAAYNVSQIPYFLKDTAVSISIHGSLSIGGDVVVKFNSNSGIIKYSDGTLTLGTGAILTSWKDDAHGGDMEANEQPAAPQAGDWKGVSFYTSGAFYNAKDCNNAINRSGQVLYATAYQYTD